MILITKGMYSKKNKIKKKGTPQKKLNKSEKTVGLKYTWFIQTGVR